MATIKVKSLDKAQLNYTSGTAAHVADWAEGMKTSGAAEKMKSAKALENFDAGIVDLHTKWDKGRQKVTQESINAGVDAVGKTRYPQGTSKAGPRWKAGTQKIMTALQAVNMPERGVAMSAENKSRHDLITQAAHDASLVT